MKRKKQLALWFLTFICVLMCGIPVSAAKTPVAKIGSKKYYSIQSAVDSVKNGQTIKLQKNIKLSEQIFKLERKVSFTLDLNKHKIQCGGNYCEMELKKGSVTIKNGSIIGLKTNQSKKGASVWVQKGAKLSIKSGSYKNFSVSNYGGTVSATGGTFRFELDDQRYISGFINHNGKMTLSGIKFYSNVPNGAIWNGYATDGTASLTIKSGTYKSTSTSEDADALVQSSGKGKTAAILGGSFSSKGDDCCIFMNSGTMTVKNAVCKAKTRCIDNSGKMTIKSGSFTSTGTGISAVKGMGNSNTVISGGTFRANGAASNPDSFQYGGDSEPYAVLCGYNASMSIRGGKFICPRKPKDKGVIGVSYAPKSFSCTVQANVAKPA